MICDNCIHKDVCSDNDNETQRDYCTWYEKERPHGEWKQVTAKDGEYYFYHKCTNCGQTIESGFDNPPLFNFCPQCGADMRKEGEKENDY